MLTAAVAATRADPGVIIHLPCCIASLTCATTVIRAAPNQVRGGGAVGAGDGTRTRYLNLGKVALCQVSYSRSTE